MVLPACRPRSFGVYSRELLKEKSKVPTVPASALQKNYFFACHLGITFANSLDHDQDQQNVGPDRGPNCLTLG